MDYPVAPLVGAWIEINNPLSMMIRLRVAPLVGAWIEICSLFQQDCGVDESLLSWERGLKYKFYLPQRNVQASLLSWERGLKFQHMNLYTIIICCVIVELVVKSIFIAITLLINNTIYKYCCKPVNSRYNNIE